MNFNEINDDQQLLYINQIKISDNDPKKKTKKIACSFSFLICAYLQGYLTFFLIVLPDLLQIKIAFFIIISIINKKIKTMEGYQLFLSDDPLV